MTECINNDPYTTIKKLKELLYLDPQLERERDYNDRVQKVIEYAESMTNLEDVSKEEAVFLDAAMSQYNESVVLRFINEATDNNAITFKDRMNNSYTLNTKSPFDKIATQIRLSRGVLNGYKIVDKVNTDKTILSQKTINKTDNTEKPVVPQFVSDWYEDNKDNFEWEVYQLCVKYHEYELEGEIKDWFGSMDNKPIETLALMHRFGYEVKEKKLYTVMLKVSNEYLNFRKTDSSYTMVNADKNLVKELKSYCYTKTELEELGIWDNPAFEIEEVTYD